VNGRKEKNDKDMEIIIGVSLFLEITWCRL
jgi:hypothetical protein